MATDTLEQSLTDSNAHTTHYTCTQYKLALVPGLPRTFPSCEASLELRP